MDHLSLAVQVVLLGYRNAGIEEADGIGASATAMASRVTIFQLEQLPPGAEARKAALPTHEVMRELYPKQGDHAVDALAFSVSGRILALGGRDNQVRLFHVSTGQPMRSIQHEHNVVGVAFSHPYGQHGELLATMTAPHRLDEDKESRQATQAADASRRGEKATGAQKGRGAVGASAAGEPLFATRSTLRVERLYTSKATSFWAKKPRPKPQLLARYIPTEYLFFDQTQSLRSLLCIPPPPRCTRARAQKQAHTRRRRRSVPGALPPPRTSRPGSSSSSRRPSWTRPRSPTRCRRSARCCCRQATRPLALATPPRTSPPFTLAPHPAPVYLARALPLQRDASGRHALDYALESNKPQLISLFLTALWSRQTPPRARLPLTELLASTVREKEDDVDTRAPDIHHFDQSDTPAAQSKSRWSWLTALIVRADKALLSAHRGGDDGVRSFLQDMLRSSVRQLLARVVALLPVEVTSREPLQNPSPNPTLLMPALLPVTPIPHTPTPTSNAPDQVTSREPELEGLMSIKKRETSLLVELARHHPSILAEQLNRLPLDEYEPSSTAPAFRRAKQSALDADDGKMALKGHPTCSPLGYSFWKDQIGGPRQAEVNVECG